MPFIKVFTNQSKAQLGDKFMPTICEKLGQVLNKDLKWFNWILVHRVCIFKHIPDVTKKGFRVMKHSVLKY